MRLFLGIDIGTFESKGVLVDANGAIVASATRSHRMLVPQPGWAEHRPREDWWGDFTFLSRKLLAESGAAPASVRAVGASAIGPCMLPVDAAGEPLMNGVLYGVDTRAAREIEELTQEIGEDRLIARCGNALTSQSVGPKVLWLKRNRPEVFRQTRKIVGATTYIVHRLTGRFVVDHYAGATASPFYAVDDLGWSDELSPGAVDLDLMPELAWTTDIAGTVTPGAAEETGLAAGTPVIVGTIDAASEAISVGVRGPGDMMLMYGSTVFIILITGERVRDPRLWYAPWLFPGHHASMSGLATSGTLTHWFLDNFARELGSDEAMATLAAEAEQSPPGARGLVVLPYFSGERTPIHDPHAKGAVFGLNLTHTRADVFRAMLEGIACGTRHVIDTYADAGQWPEAVFAVGGGTRNRAWAQATSDLCELTQAVRQTTVGAAYGDSFLAALGVGEAKPADIAEWNPTASEFRPDPAHTQVYARQYHVFRELYARTRDLMQMLDGEGGN